MLYQTDIAPALPSAATVGYHAKALLRFWGEKYLSDVMGSQCRKYAKHRASEGVSGSTARREAQDAVGGYQSFPPGKPARRGSEGHASRGSAKPGALPRAQRSGGNAKGRGRKGLEHVARFIIIGIYTGTRHRAVLGLRWTRALSGGHIDLEQGIIYRRGIADHETSKRRPPVRAEQRLLNHLLRWAAQDARGGCQLAVHWNGQPIASIRKSFASVVKDAGLGSDVTPHVLRHTCATWALWEGKTIWDVAGIIGADATTVQKVYGHHRPVSAANLRRAGGK